MIANISGTDRQKQNENLKSTQSTTPIPNLA